MDGKQGLHWKVGPPWLQRWRGLRLAGLLLWTMKAFFARACKRSSSALSIEFELHYLFRSHLKALSSIISAFIIYVAVYIA